MRSGALGAALMLFCSLGPGHVRGEDPAVQCPCFFHRHFHFKEGTPPPGRPRSIPQTDERAGYPRLLAHHVATSATPYGIGYYVGGGVACARGAGQLADDGTWGWDETGGYHFRRRGFLGWSQGRRYQGGTGAYRVDGPVVPDLIYTGTTIANSLGRSEERENP